MNKKKNKDILPIIALAIFGGILLFGFIGGEYLTISEATTLSVDRIEIRSNVPELNNEQAFLINLVANQGGETLMGEISQDTLNQLGVTGVTAGKFRIYVTTEKITYNYPLIKDKYTSGEDVVLYKVYSSTASQECMEAWVGMPPAYDWVDLGTTLDYAKNFETTYNGRCYDFGMPYGHNAACIVPIMPRGIDNHIPNIGWKNPVELGEWSYWMPEEMLHHSDSACIYKGWDEKGDWYTTNLGGIPYAEGYRIDTSANIDYRVRVTLEREDGETIATTISPSSSIGMLSDVGRVKFVGHLIAQQTPVIPAVDYAVIKYTNNVEATETEFGATIKPDKKKFVSKYAYNGYKTNTHELVDLDNDYFVFHAVDPGVGVDYIVGHWNALNNFLASMAEDKNQPRDCSISGGTVIFNAGNKALYPMLQLTVKADWIGLEISTGVPEIIEVVTPETSYEGETGIIRVLVKNNGEVDDHFDLSLLNCPNLATTTERFTVKANEDYETTLSFLGMEGTYDCTLKLQSVNSILSDEEPVSLTISQKPLPEEIIMLRGIPEEMRKLGGQVSELTKMFYMLMTLFGYAVIFVVVVVLGGVVYLVVKKLRKK